MSQMELWAFSGLIGIAASLVASIVFLLFRCWVKPNIAIADTIAKTKKNGEVIYNIKIINRTRRPIIDVKVHLMLACARSTPGGTNYELETIELETTELTEIPKFDEKDEKAPYALRFKIKEDLGSRWPEEGESNTHLRFQIYAVHSVTGFGRAYTQNFTHKKTCLKEGEYKAKNSLEIVYFD